MPGLTTIKQNYVTSAVAGQWPDWAAPGWQLTYDGKDLAATYARFQHYPFPLAETGAPAGVATATVTAPAARIVLATSAPNAAPGALPITVCGPRPEAPAITLQPYAVVTALSGNVWARPAAPGERCAKKDAPGSVVGFVAPVSRGPVLLELTATQARASASRTYGNWPCLAAQAALLSMAVFLVLRAWFRRPLAPVAALLSPRIVVREPTPEVFRSSSTAAKRAATPAG